MKIQASNKPHQHAAEKAEVTFPSGLIGLPHLTRFQLIVDPKLYPLVILRHLGEDELDYMTVDPTIVLKEYSMSIPDADAEELGISPDGEAPIILNIALVHPTDPKKATANLQSPLVINRQTGIGKQILLENCSSYSVEQELDLL